MASLEREEDTLPTSGERGSSPIFPSQEAFSQAATSMLHQLHELTGNIDDVRTLNPFGALGRLKRLDAGLQVLKPEYYRCLEHSYVQMSMRVTSGSAAAPVFQLNQLAASLPFFLRLESSWARAQAALEYKRAYAVAILAGYVSVLSVVVGVMGCALGVISLMW